MPARKTRSEANQPSLRFSPVDGGNWADLQRLFEQRGGPHSCWCMVWRDMPSKDRGNKSLKKAELEKRVGKGTPIGILGYVDDEPVAWCSVGPRPSFRRLVEEDDSNEAECVWSIVCFFIHRKHRNRGLTGRLIDYAVSYARSNGAHVVEAYPVEQSSPSYRFMGFTTPFERAGFVKIGKAGTRRNVMRLRGN